MKSPDFEYYQSSVKIGCNVWIGCAGIILDGSKINDFCVIGAGAVFKGNTLQYGVYLGNPANRVKKREIHCKYELQDMPYFR